MANIFKAFVLFLCVSAQGTIAATNESAPETLSTNAVRFFTNSIFVSQPRASEWPEVKDLLKEDFFKDVHEADEESALRRFEIVFFISLPATLFLNTAVLTAVQTVETGVVSLPAGNSRLAYLYGSTVLISLGIAMEDYRRVRNSRIEQGLEWRFFSGKF